MPKQKLLFIINPIAGFRRDKSGIVDFIRLFFRSEEFDVATTSGRGDATHLAREATKQDYGTVVAVGGDGTVNEVASGLVGSDTALGIIPRGSGNGLARGLGIPMRSEGAFKVLSQGVARTIDAGSAAHRCFFAVAGVGFDAAVGKKFNSATWRGPVPYFWIAAREFVSYQPEPLKIDFDEQHLESSPFLLTVANTKQYGNGAIIAPHAQPDDGLLDMCLVNPFKLWNAMIYVPKLFNGTIDSAPVVSYRRAKTIEIQKPGPILFHVDGEAETCEDSLRISIIPNALKVVAPSSSANMSSHAN